MLIEMHRFKAFFALILAASWLVFSASPATSQDLPARPISYLGCTKNSLQQGKINPEKSLVDAVWCNRVDLVAKFLSNGGEPNATDGKFLAPLIEIAAMNGNTELIKVLISNGANVNRKDAQGATAVYWAARQGYLDAVKDLVAAGADVNAEANDGSTPVSMTLGDGGNIEIARFLLVHGAKINTSQNGMSPLILASILSKKPWVELFLKFGAEANYASPQGLTALSVASDPAIIELLKAVGAK